MAKLNLQVVVRFSNIDPSPRPQPLLAFARFFRRWLVRDGCVNLAVAGEDLLMMVSTILRLFGMGRDGHLLELFKDIAWETNCPVKHLGEFVGQIVRVCGLVVFRCSL
jgi:hypothetical protein